MIIMINGIEWAIEFVQANDIRLLMSNGEFTLGVTDIDYHTIWIVNNLSNDLLYDVICHELCHAIIASYSLNFDISSEECVCQIMEKFSDDILYLSNIIYDSILEQS